MKYAYILLATSPVIAQIVPENKGTPLPVAEASSPSMPILLGGSAVAISLLVITVLLVKSRHRRHSRLR